MSAERQQDRDQPGQVHPVEDLFESPLKEQDDQPNQEHRERKAERDVHALQPTAVQLRMFADGGLWHQVTRCDVRARKLVDGETIGGSPHYSRQTPGADEFMASGRTLVLLTDDALAVWGVIENLDPAGGRHWRCSIFRNEGGVLSSDLIREATDRTRAYWSRRRWEPGVPLQTEIDRKKTKSKRDPGYCFLKAGWRNVGKTTKGLVLLEAP